MRSVLPFVACVTVLVCPNLAHAQLVVNPTTVSFTPSPDHGSTGAAGEPIVWRYDLELYEQGGTDAFLTLDLGKPSVGADGYVSVDFARLLAGAPRPGRPLQARVVAVGPGGWGVSEASNVFMFRACSVTVAPEALSMPPEGGNGTISVTAADGCSWSVFASATWISVTTAVQAIGTGTVGFRVSPNLTSAGRNGILTVGDRTIQIAQAHGTPPPTLFVRWPVHGATFTAPAQITVGAVFVASRVSSGTARRSGSREKSHPAVREVAFYANETLIGTASTGPYQISWRNVPAGTYVITAVATNSLGLQTTSPAVSISVK